MKTVEQLTAEQTFELAKLAYGFPEWITSELEFLYQPYDETWDRDAREFVRVKFEGIVFGDKTFPIVFEIGATLSCELAFVKYNEKTGVNYQDRLPIRNQYKIFKKLIDWGFVPKEKYK